MGRIKVVVKSKINALLVFVVLFAYFETLGFVNAQRPDIRIRDGNQRAILYSEREGAGRYLSLAQGNWQNLSIAMPNSDLKNINFDNMAHSACVSGIRIFYENPNFNEERGLVEYIYGPGSGNKCVNLKYVGGKVRSSRLVGLSSDYKASTLTLYEGDYFQGQDEFTMDDRSRLVSLDRRASSLIVTGRSPWSLYSLPNFHGDVACVSPKYPTPEFVFNLMIIGVPEGSIRSVRRGCFSKQEQIGENDPDEDQGSTRLQRPDLGEGQGPIRGQRPAPMRPHAESKNRTGPTTESSVQSTEVNSGSRRISDNLV